MKEFAIRDHEPSFLPDGNWKLAWADEFDGDKLDTSKWDYRLCMAGQRHAAWTEGGVELDGKSNCVFTLIEDENGNPVSAQLQTGHNYMDAPSGRACFSESMEWAIGKLQPNKFTHTYGYYECRCRTQQKTGWWSAFWLQSPIIGASLDPAESGSEIDIMESFEPGEIDHHHVYTGGYGKDCKLAYGGGGKIDETEFHRFGLLWDETGYTFYIDGVPTCHIEKYISKRPQFILISTEAKGYRLEGRAPTEQARAAVGDTFVVDYVRVFDKVN